MKKTTFLCMLLAFYLTGNAQSNFCGTLTDPIYFRDYPAKVALHRGSSPAARATTLYIPVFYHLIGKSNGTATKKLSDVLVSHCELNQNFLSANIQFYIVGIDSIFNDAYYQFTDYFTGDNIMNTFNVSDVCNIYINKNPNGVCGYAYFPNTGPNGGGIFLNESCHGPGTTTLTHEMGHYCGLPHTFESWGGVEFVNGTNCSSAGDYFCDTPADFLDNRWTCPYLGNQTDPNGDLYKTVLDGTLYMSYANDACHKRFSNEQKGHMYGTLQNERTALITNSFTGFQTLDSVKIISPSANDSTIPSDYALFKWHKVAGAQYYLFEIPGISVQPFLDTLVTDTFVIIKKLTVDKQYKFQVMPIAFNNRCHYFNAPTPFKTSPIRLNAVVNDIYCGLPEDGSITLNPSAGVAPFQYIWSTGDTIKNLTGLAPGSYSVTLTDAVGNSTNAQFTVSGFAPLNNNFSKSGTRLIANVSGGFPPYTYEWANGGTYNYYSPLVLGDYYSVRVTDSRGCSREFDLVYNTIPSIANYTFEVSIFPQPISNHQLAFDVNSNNNESIEIALYNMQGQLVKTLQWKGVLGNQRITFPIPECSKGLYLMHVKNGDNELHKRFIVN